MTYCVKLHGLFVVFKVNSRTIFKVPDCRRGRGCPCISIPAVRHALLCPFKTFIICLPALVNTVELHAPIWSPTSQGLGRRVTCVSFDELGREWSVLERGSAVPKGNWYFSCWWLLCLWNVSLRGPQTHLSFTPSYSLRLYWNEHTSGLTVHQSERLARQFKLTARAAAGP